MSRNTPFMDVPHFLQESRRMLEIAIASTPTSPLRNIITEANLKVMEAEAELVEINKREGRLEPDKAKEA